MPRKRSYLSAFTISIHALGGFPFAWEGLQGLGGNGWWYTIDTIITFIEGGHQFFTSPPIGQGQLIEVAQRNGRKYLKTVEDWYEPNNILALPRCPG